MVRAPIRLVSAADWQRWVLEQPWLLAGGCAVVAFLLVAIMNQRGELKRAIPMAGILLAASAGVIIAASAITTPRERVRDRTDWFMERFFAGDEASVRECMAENFSAAARGQTMDWIGRDVVAQLAMNIDKLQVESFSLAHLPVSEFGPGAGMVRFRLRLYSPARIYRGYPMDLTIDAHWRGGADAVWRLSRFDLVHSSDGLPGPGAIRNAISRGLN